jgi:hypothetical protein
MKKNANTTRIHGTLYRASDVAAIYHVTEPLQQAIVPQQDEDWILTRSIRHTWWIFSCVNAPPFPLPLPLPLAPLFPLPPSLSLPHFLSLPLIILLYP